MVIYNQGRIFCIIVNDEVFKYILENYVITSDNNISGALSYVFKSITKTMVDEEFDKVELSFLNDRNTNCKEYLKIKKIS